MRAMQKPNRNRWVRGILICIFSLFLLSAESGGAGSWRTESRGAESQGAGSQGAENQGAESGGEEDSYRWVPRVALTFDDGPHPVYTPALLDGLKERKVHATFFLLGENVDAYPRLVERLHGEGHLLGCHTYHHVILKQLSREQATGEVEDTNRSIEKITGEEVLFLRPPYGLWKDGMERSWKLLPVLWQVDSLDWKCQDTQCVVETVLANVQDGDIILMHDGYQTSVEATFRIVDELQRQGYDFVTVDELLMD